ncbi:MAG: hypothetical protein MHPSP_000755, partial [Paramarteilia canceri]
MRNGVFEIDQTCISIPIKEKRIFSIKFVGQTNMSTSTVEVEIEASNKFSFKVEATCEVPAIAIRNCNESLEFGSTLPNGFITKDLIVESLSRFSELSCKTINDSQEASHFSLANKTSIISLKKDKLYKIPILFNPKGNTGKFKGLLQLETEKNLYEKQIIELKAEVVADSQLFCIQLLDDKPDIKILNDKIALYRSDHQENVPCMLKIFNLSNENGIRITIENQENLDIKPNDFILRPLKNQIININLKIRDLTEEIIITNFLLKGFVFPAKTNEKWLGWSSETIEFSWVSDNTDGCLKKPITTSNTIKGDDLNEVSDGPQIPLTLVVKKLKNCEIFCKPMELKLNSIKLFQKYITNLEIKNESDFSAKIGFKLASDDESCLAYWKNIWSREFPILELTSKETKCIEICFTHFSQVYGSIDVEIYQILKTPIFLKKVKICCKFEPSSRINIISSSSISPLITDNCLNGLELENDREIIEFKCYKLKQVVKKSIIVFNTSQNPIKAEMSRFSDSYDPIQTKNMYFEIAGSSNKEIIFECKPSEFGSFSTVWELLTYEIKKRETTKETKQINFKFSVKESSVYIKSPFIDLGSKIHEKSEIFCEIELVNTEKFSVPIYLKLKEFSNDIKFSNFKKKHILEPEKENKIVFRTEVREFCQKEIYEKLLIYSDYFKRPKQIVIFGKVLKIDGELSIDNKILSPFKDEIIDFGLIQAGTGYNKLLRLVNSGQEKAIFEIENTSKIFKVSPNNGMLDSNDSIDINIVLPVLKSNDEKIINNSIGEKIEKLIVNFANRIIEWPLTLKVEFDKPRIRVKPGNVINLGQCFSRPNSTVDKQVPVFFNDFYLEKEGCLYDLLPEEELKKHIWFDGQEIGQYCCELRLVINGVMEKIIKAEATVAQFAVETSLNNGKEPGNIVRFKNINLKNPKKLKNKNLKADVFLYNSHLFHIECQLYSKKIRLSSNRINLGQISVGNTNEISIDIINPSNDSLSFEWKRNTSINDNSNSVSIGFDQESGIINEKSSIPVKFRITPSRINDSFKIEDLFCFIKPYTKTSENLSKEVDNGSISKYHGSQEVKIPLVLLGQSVERQIEKEIINFSCGSFRSDFKKIILQNKTHEIWNIRPKFNKNLPEFIGASKMVVHPHSSGVYEVKFSPGLSKTNNAGFQYQESLVFDLPNGKSLEYRLIGTSEPIKTLGKFNIDMDTINPFQINLEIKNLQPTFE